MLVNYLFQPHQGINLIQFHGGMKSAEQRISNENIGYEGIDERKV